MVYFIVKIIRSWVGGLVPAAFGIRTRNHRGFSPVLPSTATVHGDSGFPPVIILFSFGKSIEKFRN